MFRLQSLFETCPHKGSLSYELTIPVSNVTDKYKTIVVTPEGETIKLTLENGQAKISRHDGPGVWRFDIRIVSVSDENSVIESNIIDAVILEESPENICEELKNAIASMGPSISGDSSYSGGRNVAAEAAELYRKTQGAELPEVLKTICFERGNNTTLWRHLLLLETLMGKAVSKPYRPVIAELVTEILCTVSQYFILGSTWQILLNLPIRHNEKWIYYTRILTDSGVNNIYSHAVQELINATPPEIRPVILRVAEEIYDQDIHKVDYISRLFQQWNHKEGIPFLLSALEINPKFSKSVCDTINSLDYREAIPQLRNILSIVTMEHGGKPLAELLSSWKDEETKNILIEKLKMEINSTYINFLLGALKKYDDDTIKNTILDIKDQSAKEKAETIDKYMKNQWHA